MNDGDHPTDPGSAARTNYLILVLFLVNLVGYLDRQILSLLVGPIKQSLSLSDTMIGMLQGLAFVLTYSTAGLLLGRFVDRSDRRRLLLVCVAVWTLCAASGALVAHGWQLVISRAGVGIGEAALIPAAVSLLGDSVPAERRGRALGIFSMGVHAGAGLALVLVGVALPLAGTVAEALRPVGIDAEPWRVVLAALVLPGIVSCLLLASVREPPRRLAPAASTSFLPDWRTWAARWQVFLPHHLALALVTLDGFALGAWAPTILIREYGLTASRAGLLYGSTTAIVGAGGAYLAGRIGDRLSRNGGIGGRLGLAMTAMPLSLVGFVLLGFGSTVPQTIAGIALAFAGIVIAIVIGLVSICELAPEEARGQITSIYLMFTGILGSALGPLVAGAASDRFGGGGVSLSQIVASIGAIGSVGALLLLAVVRRRAPVGPVSRV